MKVVSLFSGCGGADLGMMGGFVFNGQNYEQTGATIVFAVDVDRKALNSHAANFHVNNVLCEDIRNIESKIIPDHDLIVGGFPCQSFSTVNPTKNPFDDRGLLYKEMARVLKEKKPRYFIAENVKGFMTLQNGKIFRSACSLFRKCGYRLSYSLLNAADFGVPQKRERVFIVGIRKDLKCRFRFPDKTHSDSPAGELLPWTSLSAVVDEIDLDEKKYYFSSKAVEGMKNAKNNMKRGLYQDLDKPCLTITSHLAKVSLNSRDPVLLVDSDKEIYRRFTPREAARIQSFPDNFKFCGSEADAYRQIGNAIPPVLMWHVVKALARADSRNIKNQRSFENNN